MKSVVYIAFHIDPPQTGGEQYNYHLLSAAEKAGIEVRRIALVDNPIYNRMRTNHLAGRFRWLFAWLWFHYQIVKHRRQELLFDAWSAPMVWPAMVFIRKRYRVILHHLCGRLEVRPVSRWWRSRCERLLSKHAARILTVSRSSRQQIMELASPDAGIDVINTAFEPIPGISRGGDEVTHLLFVGHITRAKGVVELIRAVAQLPGDLEWQLDLAGRDSMEPETTRLVRKLIDDYALSERVRMHGRVEQEALLKLYLSTDIFVLPSHWEGYGIVLLEAMSHQIAVVSTTAGAIPEVVQDGETGLLVAPGSVEELADTLESLLRDEPLRHRLASAGYAFASEHGDWQAMEEQCADWWSGDNRCESGKPGMN